jgi:hypothetical protein
MERAPGYGLAMFLLKIHLYHDPCQYFTKHPNARLEIVDREDAIS